MTISIIGTGYVGLVSGACFAETGVRVVCVDRDGGKIAALQRGDVELYEPGLEELVRRNVEAGRLEFTTDIRSAIRSSEVVFVAVGTPGAEGGNPDVSAVDEVAKTFGETIEKYTILATKSTVPTGTAERLKKMISERTKVPFSVVSNPEFLKEGAAVKDFMSPDRIVVGVEDAAAQEVMTRLYRPFVLNNFRIYFMDIPSAEMTKYAANAMLAMRISFMNEMAALCEKTGANIDSVRRGIGTDTRIGNKFLYAGAGYGGSCFPKDVKALVAAGRTYGVPMPLMEAVEAVNERQKGVLFEKLQHALGDLKNKKIALWGLSFKPETDDVREAPSRVLVEKLRAAGAEILAFDPAVKRFDGVTPAEDMYAAVEGADAVVIVTEWKQFRIPDWGQVRAKMRGNILVDGRNVYDRAEAEAAGFNYIGIGK